MNVAHLYKGLVATSTQTIKKYACLTHAFSFLYLDILVRMENFGLKSRMGLRVEFGSITNLMDVHTDAFCLLIQCHRSHFLPEEGELLAFLARRNSGSVAFSPDRDLQSVLCDNVLPYHLT